MAERVRPGSAEALAVVPRPPWYRRRGSLLLAVLLVAFTAQMVTTALRTQVEDTREVVAVLRQDVSVDQRDAVRDRCGTLPGVSVVPDQGRDDLVRRFGARFSIAGSTGREEAGLYACLDQFTYVLGIERENVP